MERDLSALVALIEDSRVDEARALADALAARWPESPGIQHLKTVLEPPRVLSTTGAPDRNWDAERAWLRDHAHEYPGCWLALYSDRLIAADADRQKVAAAARRLIGTERSLMFYQPAEAVKAFP